MSAKFQNIFKVPHLYGSEWLASVPTKKKGKSQQIGPFSSEEEAAKARDEELISLFGLAAKSLAFQVEFDAEELKRQNQIERDAAWVTDIKGRRVVACRRVHITDVDGERRAITLYKLPPTKRRY